MIFFHHRRAFFIFFFLKVLNGSLELITPKTLTNITHHQTAITQLLCTDDLLECHMNISSTEKLFQNPTKLSQYIRTVYHVFVCWLGEAPSPCQSKQRQNTSSTLCARELLASDPAESLFTFSAKKKCQRLTVPSTLISGSLIPPIFIYPWLCISLHSPRRGRGAPRFSS